MNNPFEILDARLNKIELLLSNLISNQDEQKNSAQPQEDEILNVKRAAVMVDLAIPTIYSKVAKKEIPYIKKGGKLYFSRKALMEWLKAGAHKTGAALIEEAKRY